MAAVDLGYALFGLCLLTSWGNSASHALHGGEAVYSRGVGMLARSTRPRRALALLVATVPFVALTLAFCLGWHRIPVGVALLAMMLTIRQVEVSQWPAAVVVPLGKYVPTAACLLGYVVATFLVSERAGWEAACGVMAGCWGLAAIAKVKLSGARWLEARNVALLVAERTYRGPLWLRRLRRAAANTPWLCGVAAYYGFFAEALGVLFVFPIARWPIAIALTIMQVMITLLLGYLEIEWTILVIALVLLSGSPPF